MEKRKRDLPLARHARHKKKVTLPASFPTLRTQLPEREILPLFFMSSHLPLMLHDDPTVLNRSVSLTKKKSQDVHYHTKKRVGRDRNAESTLLSILSPPPSSSVSAMPSCILSFLPSDLSFGLPDSCWLSFSCVSCKKKPILLF